MTDKYSTVGGYRVFENTLSDNEFLSEKLSEFNNQQVAFTQKPIDIPLSYCIRDEKNDIIAGIVGCMYGYGITFLQTLFVSEQYRHRGIGSLLFTYFEKMASDKGAVIILLDTFDFQAKEFYLKHGFEVFGEIRDCPLNHTRFHMLKRLSKHLNPKKTNRLSNRELIQELMRDPEFKRKYDDRGPEFQLVEKMLMESRQLRMSKRLSEDK